MRERSRINTKKSSLIHMCHDKIGSFMCLNEGEFNPFPRLKYLKDRILLLASKIVILIITSSISYTGLFREGAKKPLVAVRKQVGGGRAQNVTNWSATNIFFTPSLILHNIKNI